MQWSQAMRKRMTRQSIIRASIWVLGIGIVITMTCMEWFGLRQAHVIGYDYAFFYYAFHVVLNHQPGWQLYHISSQLTFLKQLHYPFIEHNQYVYPPQFAVLWSWLGFLPFSVSVVFWMVLSSLLYISGVYWVAKTLWPDMRRTKLLALLLVSFGLTPFQNDILVGNVNSILFAAIALTFYLHYRRRASWLAGIPLGLAIVFKVTPAAVLLYFLLRGKWRVTLSSSLTVLVASVVAVWTLGFDTLFTYADMFTSFGHESMKHGPAPYNQSLLGVLGVLRQHHVMGWSASAQHTAFLVYVVIAALVILLASWRNKKDWQMEMSIASLMPLLFSPLVEQMHFTYALPALFVLFRRTEDAYLAKNPVRLLGLAFILATLLLSLPISFCINWAVMKVHSLFFLQTQMFWALMILFGVTVWQSLRKKSHREQSRRGHSLRRQSN